MLTKLQVLLGLAPASSASLAADADPPNDALDVNEVGAADGRPDTADVPTGRAHTVSIILGVLTSCRSP